MRLRDIRGPALCRASAIGLAAAGLIASVNIAVAQQRHPVQADVQAARSAPPQERAVDPSRWDRARFDHSGSRGRLEIGASPAHPEGPGEPSD